jgi:hypothetical protein
LVQWPGSRALAIATVTSRQPETVRGFYLGMSVIGWYVIVPFCLASLITGLFVSLGTPWGLFRHYWVLIKFLITVVAALVLFGFTQTLGSLGDLAADQTLSMGELGNLKQSPVLHSGGGMLALLAATILAVYKPWGLTRYGQRVRQSGTGPDYRPSTSTAWGLYLLLGTIGLILMILVMHLIGGGPRGH